jgi:multidrug resistance efflux pump
MTRVAVKEGQRVNKGDILFESDGGSAVLDMKSAEARLETARTQKISVLGQIEEEKARLNLFNNVTRLRITRQKALIGKDEARLAAAKRMLDRMKNLYESKCATAEEFEKAQEAYDLAVNGMEEDKADLGLLQLNDKASAEGRYFDGKDIVGRISDLQQNLKVTESQVIQAEQDVQNAKVRLKNLVVKASASGVVYAVYHRAGELINPNMTVLTLSTSEGYCIVAGLRPDEAYLVQPGAKVDMNIPDKNIHFTGHVDAIGRRAVSVGNENSLALEVSSVAIPCRVLLDGPPRDLAPGARVVVNIHLRPFGKLYYR